MKESIMRDCINAMEVALADLKWIEELGHKNNLQGSILLLKSTIKTTRDELERSK